MANPARVAGAASSMRRPALWLLGLLVTLAAAETAHRLGVPITSVTRDPAVTEGDSPFRGAVSNLGLFLWAGGGTALLLAAAAGPPERRSFLATTGVGVLALGVDDALLLHEEAASRTLGLPEWPVYLLYLGAAALWYRRFSADIRRSDAPLLGVAVGAFALSLAIDVIGIGREAAQVAEDTAKYYGLVVLCWWCVTQAVARLRATAVPHSPARR